MFGDWFGKKGSEEAKVQPKTPDEVLEARKKLEAARVPMTLRFQVECSDGKPVDKSMACTDGRDAWLRLMLFFVGMPEPRTGELRSLTISVTPIVGKPVEENA